MSLLCWRAEKFIFPTEILWNLKSEEKKKKQIFLKYSKDL